METVNPESSGPESAAAKETPQDTARPASCPHPVALTEADRPYLAPWGRAEVRRFSLLGVVATIAFAAAAWWLSPWWALGLVPVVALWAFFVLFFRNPQRSIPTEVDVLVAPADGTIWDIETIAECPHFPGPALRIGIFLSVFDVHVNRAPCDARVDWTRYVAGHFHDARSPEAARENEAQWIGLVSTEGVHSGQAVVLRLISGAIARRIVSPLDTGEQVARGGLIGMIKYGSRTEVWLPAAPSGAEPAAFAPRVKVGDKVRGGATILGAFASAEPSA